jgi:hypothetical protein
MIRNINYLFIVSTFGLLSINCSAGDQLIDQMISTYKANQARFHTQYRGSAIQGQGVVSEINADSLKANMYKLVSFGTRNTLSTQGNATRGIGAARRWILSRFNEYAKQINNRMDDKIFNSIKANISDKSIKDINNLNYIPDKTDNHHVLITSRINKVPTDWQMPIKLQVLCREDSIKLISQYLIDNYKQTDNEFKTLMKFF